MEIISRNNKGYGDFEHVIGQAEITYKIAPTVLTAIGYRRDFTDSYYANFYSDDSVYLRASMRFADLVNLSLLGSFHFIRYAEFDPVEENGIVIPQ